MKTGRLQCPRHGYGKSLRMGSEQSGQGVQHTACVMEKVRQFARRAGGLTASPFTEKQRLEERKKGDAKIGGLQCHDRWEIPCGLTSGYRGGKPSRYRQMPSAGAETQQLAARVHACLRKLQRQIRRRDADSIAAKRHEVHAQSMRRQQRQKNPSCPYLKIPSFERQRRGRPHAGQTNSQRPPHFCGVFRSSGIDGGSAAHDG